MIEEETKGIPRKSTPPGPRDIIDRRILGALSTDADRSYAEIGTDVGLSPPAVHERVKRLKANGTIQSVHADLDGPAIGRPLIAFIHIDTSGWGKSPEMMEIARYPEVEEIHSVAGDTGAIMKVRTETPHALEALLAEIYRLPNVVGTRSYIALSTYLERGVQADTTKDWPPLPHTQQGS